MEHGDQMKRISEDSEISPSQESVFHEMGDSSATENSKDDITAKMACVSLTKTSSKEKLKDFAKRPDTGNSGKAIRMIANYFALKCKDVCIYHYDVDIFEVDKNSMVGKSIIPEEMTVKEAIEKHVKHVEHQQNRRMGKRDIISSMVKSADLHKYGPVYDGQKNILTCKALPFKDETSFFVDLQVGNKCKMYCIILKPVKKDGGTNVISLEPLREMYAGRSRDVPNEVLMAFETILAHREPPLTQVQARSSFFPLVQERKVDLGRGLEVWFGYNQRVNFTEKGPAVIINLAAKAFHKSGSAIQYANEVLNCDITKIPRLNELQIKALSRALRRIRVQVTHQQYPRKYNVRGVSRLPAKDHVLIVDQRRLTISEFFAEKYEKLKYPHLHCLHMKTSRITFIPIENCVTFEGQPNIGKLNPFLSSKMIRQSAIAPEKRFMSLMKDSRIVANISIEAMENFGLSMETQMMEISGRIISPPLLSYDNAEQVNAVKPDIRGVWRMDSKRFLRPRVSNKWILISFAQPKLYPNKELQKLASCLACSAGKLGLKIGSPCEIKIFSSRDKTRDALLYAQSKAEFAVVVLSRNNAHHKYEEVKFVADFELGFVTQCMEDRVVGRVNSQNDQITNNVCLKINIKLGGTNHILSQMPRAFSKLFIVFGADTIHWPRGFGHPSIAAVVGSLDPHASLYALTCRIQENRNDKKISQEIILEMKDIVTGILRRFIDTNAGQCPRRLIFFRDGVSEGQFSTAHEIEVGGMMEASKELFGYVVPITYIIVQKRHQTRFRPKVPKDGIGKMGNIPAGTVVDTEVVHPVYFDYFLCSHEGIQGTSKPSHYTVIHDDSCMGSDELQELSFHLCHLYGRCNRSVSIPAPVYYAHLAAGRAKSYADLHIADDDGNSSSSSIAGSEKLPQSVFDAINGMHSFRSMFFI